MIRFAANFQPKLNELHKHLQNQQKLSKYAGFLIIFCAFFNFGLILAAKQIMVVILRSFRLFWYPWHPLEWLSSGDIWVLRFVLIILLQWRRLADFFISIKMISHITFMLRSFDFVILSLLTPKKVTITKIHHLIRLNFERSEHKKSQCEIVMWWAYCAPPPFRLG